MRQHLDALTPNEAVSTTVPAMAHEGSRQRHRASPYNALLQPLMSLLARNVRDGCECVPEAILGYN